MKDITFYQEFKNKRKGVTAGTCLAVFGPAFNSGGSLVKEAISGVFAIKNSPVASSSVSLDYLKIQCKRTSEAKARAIHPALFVYLNQNES